MASFQTIVGYTAIFMFLILMIIIAVLMNAAKRNTRFPPQISACPDYWQQDASTGRCRNVNDLGINCPKQPTDFNTATYLGPGGKVAKCNFAKNCSIEWDGVSNQSLC